MRIPLTISTWAALALIGAAVVSAADRWRGPTTRPSVESTPAATLVEFSGLVEIRSDMYDPWRRPERTAQIPFNGEIRTGPRAMVELQFEGTGRIIVVNRLGTSRILKIWEWSKRHPLPPTGTVQYERDEADPDLHYGHTRYVIEESGIVHTSELRFPSTTFITCRLRVSFSPTTQKSLGNWLSRLLDPQRWPAAATTPPAAAAASHSAASTQPAR